MMGINVDQLFADQKKLALLAVVFCAAVYCDAAFLIGGQMKHAASLKSSIAAKNTEINGIARDMALMSQKGGEPKSVRMFTESGIPQMLKYLSSLAGEHSIKLLQITPLKSKEAKAMQSQHYLGLAIKLDLSGSYHDLGGFLSDLELGEHPIFADEIKISQGEDFLKQRVSLTLRTYVKK